MLVVDDEPAVLRILRLTLEAEGYEVLAAPSGREAVRALASAHVDLLLTDLIMPNLDGEALAAIAERLPAPPRVVIMSGFGSSHQREQLRWPLIVKPFDLDTLLTQVADALADPAPVLHSVSGRPNIS